MVSGWVEKWVCVLLVLFLSFLVCHFHNSVIDVLKSSILMPTHYKPIKETAASI